MPLNGITEPSRRRHFRYREGYALRNSMSNVCSVGVRVGRCVREQVSGGLAGYVPMAKVRAIATVEVPHVAGSAIADVDGVGARRIAARPASGRVTERAGVGRSLVYMETGTGPLTRRHRGPVLFAATGRGGYERRGELGVGDGTRRDELNTRPICPNPRCGCHALR